MAWQERKQRLRAKHLVREVGNDKTICGRHPLKNALGYHRVLFSVFGLIGLMLIYFFGIHIFSSFLKCDGVNKDFFMIFLRVEDAI